MDKKKLKEVINNTLKWNNLEIDDNELDEVIKKYEYYHDRYDFINNHLEWDICYKNIFVNLAIFKKSNLLYCLDYLYLINGFRGTPIYNIVNTLLSCTQSILAYYHDFKGNMDTINNRINHFYNKNPEIITVWLDSVLAGSICDSSYIPSEYKDVINLYMRLCELARYDMKVKEYDISFDKIINISYYYFMANNYFNTECNDVIKFLEYMYDNPVELLDKVQLTGILYRDDFYNYFDNLYNNSKSNKKAIK